MSYLSYILFLLLLPFGGIGQQIIHNGIVAAPPAAALKVSADFEGGSATVLGIDTTTQTVRITPSGDPARGIPNWWYLRVDNLNISKPFVLEVFQKEATLPTDIPGKMHKVSPEWTWPTQATFSTEGKTWEHTIPGKKQGNKMVYTIESRSPTLWIAWGPPFTPSDAIAFTETIARQHSFARSFILAQSREHRSVPALQIKEGNKPSTQRPAVWVHARQHAWECGGSWVGVGFAEWLVGNDPQAKWLRQHAEIFIIPLMDVDHVATGDGGKHALPQDHNLDWTHSPHWPEVAAAQKRILALANEGRMSVFLDLHNPGPGNTQQTAYVIDKAYMKEKAEPRKLRFVQLMIGQYGSLKQIVAKPPAEMPEIFHNVSVPWVLEHSNPNTIAFCIETPWNASTSTTQGYRVVGQKLAHTVVQLLQEEQ
jgi:hypothetical protein